MQRLCCASRGYTFKWRKDIVQDNTPVDAAADVAQYELDNANTQAHSYRECRKLVNIVKIGGLLIYQEYYRFKPSFR